MLLELMGTRKKFWCVAKYIMPKDGPKIIKLCTHTGNKLRQFPVRGNGNDKVVDSVGSAL